MTNILLLPLLSSLKFSITNNGDWNDSIFFGAPGTPPQTTLSGCGIVSGSGNIAVTSAVGLVPGMPIAQTPGIPAGAFIGAITSLTALTMVDALGASLPATATNAVATLIFQPLPLDLTGISFVANLRSAVDTTESYMTIQTSDSTFINGGKLGVLSFDISWVDGGVIANLFPGEYVLDIVAEADGVTINLFPEGPAKVTVLSGVTDPTT